MKLHADNTAAIFIDFQEKLVPAIDNNEAIIAKTAILAKGLQQFGIPIVVSQQYTKGLGDTVPTVKEAFETFSYIEKTSFSCCDCEELAAWIQNCGKENIIVCGVEAHICVLQTVLDLIAQGKHVFVPVDCIGSRKQIDLTYGIKRLEKEGAYLASTESVLFELTGGAKSPQFKAISKLVK